MRCSFATTQKRQPKEEKAGAFLVTLYPSRGTATFNMWFLWQGGWGKKLSYVVAFGRHGVMDVSQRYSTNRSETLERQRRLADPAWVQQACRAATLHLRRGTSAEEATLWEKRESAEMRELHTTPQPTPDSNLPGEPVCRHHC